jgi:hypothetical protein
VTDAPLAPSKPLLAELFESIAVVTGLGEARVQLELDFTDGFLRRWTVREIGHGANGLGRFDASAARLAPPR